VSYYFRDDKEYTLPHYSSAPFEDAFDESRLLSFRFPAPHSTCYRKTAGKYWQRLVKATIKDSKDASLPYFESRCPPKWEPCILEPWVDHERREYFDTCISRTALKICPFQGGGCYLLLGTSWTDYHFHVTVSKWPKYPSWIRVIQY
jgi:hypothetical protein